MEKKIRILKHQEATAECGRTPSPESCKCFSSFIQQLMVENSFTTSSERQQPYKKRRNKNNQAGVLTVQIIELTNSVSGTRMTCSYRALLEFKPHVGNKGIRTRRWSVVGRVGRFVGHKSDPPYSGEA